MSDATMPQALVSKPADTAAKAQSAVIRVAKEHGVSPLKQFLQMTKLRLGAPKLASNEYYAAQLYRPDLTSEDKQQFVGETRNKALNLSMSPPQIARISDFLQDKVLYNALLAQLGLSTIKTQAVFSARRGFGALPTLRSEADITRFLTTQARFPLFGKPVEGSKSVGSALFTSVDAKAGTLTLGNGRVVELAPTVSEIVTKFTKGYVFEDAVTQHGDMTQVAGPALGTLRIVTVMEDDAPRPLYALWKIPAPGAMSDNFWQDGSMLAELDVATGEVLQIRRGSGVDMELIENHPVSGKPMRGMMIPHWKQATDLARQAHGLATGNGVLGFDIGMTQTGPVVVECNTNPFHTLYQLATGRGILNADFAPVFKRIAAAKAAVLAAAGKAKAKV